MDSAAASPRVLVVDDDDDVLASLERGLRLSGFDVSTAKDGAEALRSATETRPDAIVLDINMPVLDGVSVVTALRAATPVNQATRSIEVSFPVNLFMRAAPAPVTRPPWKATAPARAAHSAPNSAPAPGWWPI